jgi:uncharacterized protein
MNAFSPTARSRVKRLPKRGHYDREAVHAILDAALLCHVGYVIDGQPYVTPTAFWREGDRLYWHGSSASRMLRAQSAGLPVCLTVAHLDGLVLARSGFHHSLNYRSVMAFGTAHKVDDPAEKVAALDAFVDRLYPGRRAEIRPNTAQEVKATTVLSMVIEEASAKIRTGPPVDDEEDYALPCWAGVIPIRTIVDPALTDPRLAPGVAWPDGLAAYAPGATFETVLEGVEKA